MDISQYNMDEPTQYMLDNVIKRKEKLSSLQAKKQQWKWGFFCSLLMGGGYGYITFLNGFWSSFSSFFDFMLGRTWHLLLIIIVISSYFKIVQVHKKCEKAEKEFHELRCEIIKKSKDLWPTSEEWKGRKDIYHMMKKEYDINLYYENK
ncbi:DUF2663 family protein [Priestia megaterium]|nr:DUF2663 family protein [Priestia megaterium]